MADDYTVTEDLWLNADKTKVVKDGDDPEAAFLLAIPGDVIGAEDAKKYGLVKEKPKAADKARKKTATK